MGLFSLLGVMSPAHMIGLNFLGRLGGASKRIGVDSQGNKYYAAKPRKGYKRQRRWVIYKGVAEASKIPPEWHGWMHHQTDVIPSDETQSFRRKWQKPHAQNLTGTEEAYFPPGHELKGGQREKATGDYEAWTPPK